MPELPEVETIKNDLLPVITGKTILAVEYTDSRPPVQGASPVDFARAVSGVRITSVSRRAKHLIIALEEKKYLVVHLRMTGRLFYLERDEPVSNLTRVIIHLDDGHDLRLEDQRRFGYISLLDQGDFDALCERLGPEPLTDDFTAETLAALMGTTNRNIKAILLDQNQIAGLGNIYVDEALFEARLHPTRTGRSLNRDEIEHLHAAIRKVLQRGIATRGTTFSDYRDAFGRPGEHQDHLRVFLRHGKPCLECGTTIEKSTVAGRGTHTCPSCQPKPGE